MASATTSGIQLHITHGFLLIRIECLSMDRIDPLVNTALIKAVLHQPGCLKVDGRGQGDQGLSDKSWRRRGDGRENVHRVQELGECTLLHPTAGR